MNYKLDTDDQVFFYEQDFYVLSNFSAFSLMWKGHRFDTLEAAYHWEKFKDEGIKFLILHSPSAHEAFKMAEKHKSFYRADWYEIRVEIMLSLLREKVKQHAYVKKKLVETGTRELIEDSWRDDFWGWGKDHKGKNMLGRCWMKVREELAKTKDY